jgi:hypothetical protein
MLTQDNTDWTSAQLEELLMRNEDFSKALGTKEKRFVSKQVADMASRIKSNQVQFNCTNYKSRQLFCTVYFKRQY